MSSETEKPQEDLPAISIEKELKKSYPDHKTFENREVGEEYSHDENRYLWIFDPIDGVDNFQAGIPIWGMSLALIDNFWPIFGVFYMPSTGDQPQSEG